MACERVARGLARQLEEPSAVEPCRWSASSTVTCTPTPIGGDV